MSTDNEEISLDVTKTIGMSSGDYLTMADDLLRRFKNLIQPRSGLGNKFKAGAGGKTRSYLEEADEILRTLKSKGKLRKSSSFSPSFYMGIKVESSEKAEQRKVNSKVMAAPKSLPLQTNIDREIEEEDVSTIINENINSKEGLKAIVTELIKRRVEKLKAAGFNPVPAVPVE